MFFQNQQKANVLSRFLSQSDAAHFDEPYNSRLQNSRKIIKSIHKSPVGWDSRCSFNINHIGDEFIRELEGFDPSVPSNIDYIFLMSYRFLCEFDFLVGAGKELSMDLKSVKENIQNDVGEMDDRTKSQIIYASYAMPANITKEFINRESIGAFEDFKAKKEEAEGLKTQWDGEIEAKTKTVGALKDQLDKYKDGFNFVGLYHGFSELATKKDKEALWLFRSLIGIGILVLTPLTAEIIFSISGVINSKELGLNHLMILLPLISIEVILIYFFRVVLLNHRSVKAQIMQIELRKTLCQFIQSYAGYSSEIKQQDPSALEKFENLIFSGLVSDPDKLPSTFDGMEKIGSLVKSFKNSS